MFSMDRRLVLIVAAGLFVALTSTRANFARAADEPAVAEKEVSTTEPSDKSAEEDKAATKSETAVAQKEGSKTAESEKKDAENKATSAGQDKPEGEKKSEETYDPHKAAEARRSAKDARKVKLADSKRAADEAKNKSEKEKKAAEEKKPGVVRFVLSGDYKEGPAPIDAFGDVKPSLGAVIQRFDDAAKDDTVAAVWLRIEGTELGRGKVAELRAAIKRVRAAGKPVFAEVASAESEQYLLASACDKVIMPPSGVLMLPGVRMETLFIKGLLDKIGVRFEALQMGKYKGAAEPLTRSEMSDSLRESLEALVDDAYGATVDSIAADRDLKDYQVKTLIDQGVFTAPAARQAKLIDEVLYADQIEEAFRKQLKSEAVRLVTDYKKKKVDTDFSGIGGFMKLMELMMGGKPEKSALGKKKIAVVYATGPITEGKSESDMFGTSSVGSTTLVAAIKKAAEDNDVVGIVLRIDSPGGSAIASDLIWREITRVKKPVIASMGNVAASGGYYIAMGAKKIFAAPATITGSIGVIGGKMVFTGLFEKLDVKPEVISRGAMSGSFSSSAPFSDAERNSLTRLMRDIYRQFVRKAAEGRHMKVDKMQELAQGRVYSGTRAAELGLVDAMGTLHDAIREAKIAGGLDADDEVEILVLPRPQSFFEQLFGGESISGEVDSSLVRSFGAILPEALPVIAEARRWRSVFAHEPAVLWLPYSMSIK